jgi:thiol-disulfide isomerase/thioredoxin
MKKTTFTALLLLIFANIFAQNNIEKSALLNANQMISFYNSKDFINYVNYLLPKDYGNDPANKGKLADLYKKITNNETGKINIIKVLKTSTINGQNQALLSMRHNNLDLFLFGISNDKAKNWFFSSYTAAVQFDQIIEKIPTIDKAFSKFVDPKFGKRISYEIGNSIAPFSYTDINGNLLSSDSLRGKVIVLNLWGIACPPCVAEMPELNKLVEKMKGKEVVFIAPAIQGTKEYIKNNFLPKHPFNYQIVCVNGDDYSITSFPTNLVIDQNLKIVEKLVGASPENLKKLEQKINELIKE